MALAPAGQRTWAVGEVVTQTLIQTFIQDQVIGVMTESARDALSVSAASEGSMVYNTTDNTLDIYNGSAWKQLIDIDTWVSDGSGNYTVTGGLDTSGGTFVATTHAGAPSASSANGAIAIDTTNNKLYFRSGSAWRLASEESDTAADGGDSGSYVRLFICADGGGAS